MGNDVTFFDRGNDPFDGLEIQNESGVLTSEVLQAVREDQRLLAQFMQWTGDTRGDNYSYESVTNGFPHGRRGGGIFERDRYVTPESSYAQMKMAYDAVESDDIVGGVADTSEALAFRRVSFYAEEKDEQDVYNQIAADLDLDARLREMWRELFTCSQFYGAVWWTRKTYTVRGTTESGNKKRKSYLLEVPEAITLLDPLTIVPIGSTMFNREGLAYIATPEEAIMFDDPAVRIADPIIGRLIAGRYTPTEDEKRWMKSQGLNTENLYRLNPNTVFRHTVTRPQFRRVAPVRMKSVFELLDMKHQLRGMDRAHLIGGTNFIVLIKKGTDQIPGKPAEISNLQQNVKTLARLPVIVGDHRLSVEIITPKLDTTLDSSKYSTIDQRITARLYGMFLLGGTGSGAGARSDDSSGLVKVIARGIESRRHMIQRSLERNIFKQIVDRNESLVSSPKLKFHPKSIDLGFDAALAASLMELRQSNELSRETLLSQFDLDQDDEARMLQREEEEYDEIFQTQVPFSVENPRNEDNPQPNVETPTPPAEKRRAGRQGGGNKNGGGAAPGTGQGKKPRDPRKTSD